MSHALAQKMWFPGVWAAALASLLAFSFCEVSQAKPQQHQKSARRATGPIKRTHPSKGVPQGLSCLWQAYPEHICRVRKNSLQWCDGTEMVYDDGRDKKDHHALLNQPDLQDQMAMRYPVGRKYPIPLPKDFEPGRVRYEPFFMKMYGKDRREVRRNTRKIQWMPRSAGRKIRVTTVNGVDRKLEAISRELDKLSPKLKEYVRTLAGTFHWRVIKGTKRLSMHSFAVAIDVGIKFTNYWKWARARPDGTLPYRNRIPMKIVEIFEKHGFIWGGKWYHYDTMHFEYRPELLQPGCANSKGIASHLAEQRKRLDTEGRL